MQTLQMYQLIKKPVRGIYAPDRLGGDNICDVFGSFYTHNFASLLTWKNNRDGRSGVFDAF